MSEDVSLLDKGAEHLVQVQIGAADPAGGHAHQRVRGLLDRGIGNRLDPDIPLAVVGDCFHAGRRQWTGMPCSCREASRACPNSELSLSAAARSSARIEVAVWAVSASPAR